MTIAESTSYRYWPEGYPGFLSALSATVGFYRAETYQDLYMEFLPGFLGENVSFASINSFMDVWDDTNAYARCPLGYLDIMDPFDEFNQNFTALHVVRPIGSIPYDPYLETAGMAYGLFIWQSYKLRLAIQAQKMCGFGRRGRPRGVDY